MSARTNDSGLKIRASNRLEILLDDLARQMRDDPLGPLEREVIVVQSRGMYRWVTLELARRLGIAATLATPFPGTFCRALAERIDGSRKAGPAERYEPAEGSPYERDTLAWRIFALLGGGTPEIVGPAAVYLADDADQQKRHQLALRLAGRFDEYLLYRSGTLLEWERGRQPIQGAHRRSADWQASLWRAVVSNAGADHPARRFTDLIASLNRRKAPAGLPRRVSVFGASSLPPIFLDVLGALARHGSVTVYFANPTPTYWADIRTPRAVARQLELFRERGLAEEYAHVEVGNPLLASLGAQGRELHDLLTDRDVDGAAWSNLDYVTPERTSVLGAIQADVVELIERVPGAHSAARAPLALPSGDRSLEVHVCHSPMREMEVLRDTLLDAFAADADLRPHDVFVLAPDIGTYAPYIEAVFGVDHEGEPKIPYGIADRSTRHTQAAVDAALRILEMVGGRATAPSVLELLDVAAVRRAASLGATEIATVREWVRTTNVHWGIDAEHRRVDLRLECDDTDTWRAGLDRMLMGYAVGAADTLVEGIFPSSAALAGEADLLGRFAAFAGRLFAQLRGLSAPRALDAWARDIRLALVRLLAPVDEAEQQGLQGLLDAVDALARVRATAGVGEPVDIAVVREHLRGRLEDEAGGGGFLTGAVTFCALQPMRAIPAKVVCVVGLGDKAFPRLDRRPSFDLMAAEQRKGDRSPRADDRYAFLETILAARERLILMYVGRSQRDNSAVAPSILLSELLDYVDRSFSTQDSSLARKHLIVEHPLQPFSAAYFTDTNGQSDAGRGKARGKKAAKGGPAARQRASYSKENCRGAAAAQAQARRTAVLCATPLAEIEWSGDLGLADLVEFWVNPSKHFCRSTLGLRLRTDQAEVADTEPFELGALDAYGLKTRLLAHRLAGSGGGEGELGLVRAAGGLPHGGFARAAYELLRDEMEAFTRAVAQAAGGLPGVVRSELIDIAGDGWRVVGELDQIHVDLMLRYRPATLKPKDRLRAWINHVALNAWADQQGAKLPRTTLLLGQDATLRLRPLARAHDVLDRLVAGYREGLRRALPVFEAASFTYAECKRKEAQASGKAKSPLVAAYTAFHGNDWSASGEDGFRGGDIADAYVELCTRDRDPFASDTAELERLALELWQPALDAMEEMEL